jgi:tetratricopeptide (TPR) repeat protein
MRRLLLTTIALVIGMSGNALADNEALSMIQKGYELTQAGQLDKALDTLREAVNKDPDSSLGYTRLGGVRLLRQEYTEGIRDFQHAIILDQSNASAFIGMAVAYLHMGRYELAKAALDEAEKLDPSKQTEIGKVVAWIEQRTKNTAPVH